MKSAHCVIIIFLAFFFSHIVLKRRNSLSFSFHIFVNSCSICVLLRPLLQPNCFKCKNSFSELSEKYQHSINLLYNSTVADSAVHKSRINYWKSILFLLRCSNCHFHIKLNWIGEDLHGNVIKTENIE